MKIKFLDSHTMSLKDDMDFSQLEKTGEYHGSTITNEDDIAEHSKDSQILITNKIKIDDNILEKLPELKLICVIATGYNIVDIEAAARRNIVVTNVPQYAKYSVSQHAFALILNLASNICRYNNDVKEGKWEKSTSFSLLTYPAFELAGKTMGIIGLGAIGRETAKIAKVFNMDILVYDISDVTAQGYNNSTLEEVLNKSDIISIHAPLTPETRNLITKKELQQMKKTSIIINTSRGGIINETDLARALNSGIIGGAGIDVLTEEPPSNGNPLIGEVKNLIITPHTAWSSKEARQRLIDVTAENIQSFLSGENKNKVN